MSNGYSNGPAVQRTDAAIDQGLRSFFLRTFNIMALGVALTGLVAWFVGSQYISTAMGESVALSGLIQVLYGTPLRWVLVFAPLGLSFLFGGAIWVSRPAVSHAMFWTFCTVFALAVVPLLASFMVTAVDKIFLAFLMSAFGFLSLSIYGYTTKADLTSWGTFGRVGILVAIVGSLGMLAMSAFGLAGAGGLSIFHMVINLVVAIASLALTAFSMQMLKSAYYSIRSGQVSNGLSVEQQLESAGVAGALSLYINFMNLFLSLLSLLRGGGE